MRAALPEFDRDAFNAGHLTPVYFGSAIKGIGVNDLLDGLAEYGPPPRAQQADTRMVEATEPGLTALVFKIQANMDPNHRDRIAFARVCSGPAGARHAAEAGAHRQADPAARAAVLLRPRARDRRRGVRRRRGRHPQPRHAAHRRHADRGRGPELRRRAVFRPGNPAPRAAGRRDEGEEAAPGAGRTGGGRRGAVVPPAGRRRAAGRRGRHLAARRAAGAAGGGIRRRDRLRDAALCAGALGVVRPTRRRWRNSSPPTAARWRTTWMAIRCSWRPRPS